MWIGGRVRVPQIASDGPARAAIQKEGRAARPPGNPNPSSYMTGERGSESQRNPSPEAINATATPPTTATSIPVNGSVPAAPSVAVGTAVGVAVLLLAADPLPLVPCTWDSGAYWAAAGFESASCAAA